MHIIKISFKVIIFFYFNTIKNFNLYLILKKLKMNIFIRFFQIVYAFMTQNYHHLMKNYQQFI